MSDKKISQLNELVAANVAPSTDLLAIVDTSATETKKISAKGLVDGALNTLTASGILYLDGSKVIQSAGLFDGTSLSVTTLDATNLEVTNLKAKDGTAAGSIANSTGVITLASSVLTTTAIAGGTINSASVGATTPSTGAFTTLSATGAVTFNPANAAISLAPTGTGTVTINPATAGSLNNVAIGATTRAAGNFTTLNANGNVTLGDATADTISANGRFNTDIVPSTDNARDLGTSALKFKDIYGVRFLESGQNLIVQADTGTAPNQIPLNQYLGAVAYLNDVAPAIDVGLGITTGTNTVCRTSAGLMGGVYSVRILVDLRGLNSGGTAGDIIGVNGTALPCYIARLPAMTVLGGRMTCLETPAGGDTDLDLYSATEGTGVEDQAITALTETEIIDAGTQSRGTVTFFSANPAANTYLYLVGQSTSNATYTAGRFLIEIFGVQ